MLFPILVVNLLIKSNCIWPPEYKVNLVHEEEFIISELLNPSDVQDVYEEEEMIQKEDLKSLKLNQNLNSGKYFRLHKQAKRQNINVKQNLEITFEHKEKLTNNLPLEFNLDKDEPLPWIGGIVDRHGNFKDDENMLYFDDTAKSNKSNSDKLHKRNATINEEYNYENLKDEYNKEVKKAEIKNDTLKYKEVKEDELPKEAAKTLVDFTSKNCTEEEKNGIGVAAVKCFWMDARHKSLNKNKKVYILKKILLISILWVLVYLAIVLPLWCQYGWCCCCFRCKFCQPKVQIDEVKTFYANNPPGIYHDENGLLIEYKPTRYEMYAYKELEKGIQRL